jgi:hypothetical protein
METRMTLGGVAPFGHYFVAEPRTESTETRRSAYLDTSVPSYLVARLSTDLTIARRQLITRTWWERHRHQFAIYTSKAVTEEASAGNPDWARRRLAVLSEFPELSATPDSDDLSRALMTAAALPISAAIDAKHIAIAAVNSVDFLLTWNCKHLANANAAHKIARTCEAAGFRTPKICTPEALVELCNHEMPNP